MRKIKYLASYFGPSYFSYDQERMMGLASISEAKRTFLDFYGGSVVYQDMRQNADGLYVEWEQHAWSRTPGTSEQDVMYVYYAHEVLDGSTRGTHEINELAFVVGLGPRGGVILERA